MLTVKTRRKEMKTVPLFDGGGRTNFRFAAEFQTFNLNPAGSTAVPVGREQAQASSADARRHGQLCSALRRRRGDRSDRTEALRHAVGRLDEARTRIPRRFHRNQLQPEVCRQHRLRSRGNLRRCRLTDTAATSRSRSASLEELGGGEYDGPTRRLRRFCMRRSTVRLTRGRSGRRGAAASRSNLV